MTNKKFDNTKLKPFDNSNDCKDEIFYCPKCYNKARAEALAEVNGIVDKFDFEVVKEKYKPNMDLIKLIKEELKSKLKQLEGKSLVEKGK